MTAAAGALLLALLPLAGAPSPSTWLLVISGVGGDAEHRAAFVQLADRLIGAAEQHGVAPERIIYLAESTELASRARARASRESIIAAIGELAGRAAATDPVIVVLLGHGNTRGGQSYVNLPGPDMGGADFAAALQPLAGRSLAVVNTAAASGGFVAALAAPGRVVITATRADRELLEPSFGRFFVDAFVDEAADLDKDGRVSLLEAFRFANAQVERLYEEEGRLRTEHAQLDDDGDGRASEAPDGEAEGALAALIGLGGPGATAGPADDPELSDLRARRFAAEQQLAALRARRGELTEEEYEAALEEVLVRIAEIDAAIRARGGQR